MFQNDRHSITEYQYRDARPTWAHAYLWPALKNIIACHEFQRRRALDLGCGNGATANLLAELGFDFVGVDPSESGITQARQAFPTIEFYRGSGYDDIPQRFGSFSLVVSLEVIEHCYDPRHFIRMVFNALEEGGLAVISTPYHGYLKNLMLAITGKWDDHLTALWDGGHIKFFSVKTLQLLLEECGFRHIHFLRVDRVSVLAKSMIAVATK